MDNSTEQEKRKGKGNPNPSPETRFGAPRGNPQNPGGWKKENTFSYQMNRFKNMTIQELQDWNSNTPIEVRTVAEDLAYRRVFNAQSELNEFKEVADRTEGKARQPMEYSGGVTVEVKQIADEISEMIASDHGKEEESNTDFS